MDVPMGFRFLPEPYECIEYLHYKVMGRPLPCNGVIFDLDPYNLKQLPDIFSATESKGDLYLFTKLSKKGKIGSTNVNRKVGKGTWHGVQTQNIRDHNGTPIGKSINLSYKEEGSINDKRFLMTEYTLPKRTSLHYDPLKDYVLCHLYKNPRWKNRQRVQTSSYQEPAILQAPSPAATEPISSVVEVEMELSTDFPSTSTSGSLYAQPLAMEVDYSQCSVETAVTLNILDTLLPTDFDIIDSWFNDPLCNDFFELIDTNHVKPAEDCCSGNQEPVVHPAPSPAAAELISSMVELEMELPTDLPSTTASNPLYVEPLAIEAAHSQASDENALAGDILDNFLRTDFDIDICYHDPSWNDCFELMNGTDF